MKVVILAGGTGTRLSEETIIKPKPIVELCGKPIIWHIMKIYSYYGFKEFIICCGYKGYLIKDYFSNYTINNSDFIIDLKRNKLKTLNKQSEDWKIALIDTGIDTLTGGRIKRIRKYLHKNENFFMTYGDGVANINIKNLLSFHKSHNKLATISIVQPIGRYGSVNYNSKTKLVDNFIEKPKGDNNWINGGFFVLNEKVIDYIRGDEEIWEKRPLERLSKNKQLMSYKHEGFWKAMDSLNDKNQLEELILKKTAPWIVW
jgi:glucose-1-phosphate cytidylyltransferase